MENATESEGSAPATLSEEERPDQCRAIVDGRPCGVPATWVKDGWCFAHNPALEAERRAANLRGGMTTARLLRKRRGLEEGELGALQTPEDAQRWCMIAATAVATGRMSASAASALRGLVTSWLRSRDLHVRETRLLALEKRVAELNGGGYRP